MRRAAVAGAATAVLALAGGAGAAVLLGGDEEDDGQPRAARTSRPVIPTGTLDELPPGLPPGDLGAWIRRRTPLRASPGGRVVARLGRKTRFDSPQVLAVVAHRGDWLGVLHHALPNGRTGWIAARDARIVREPYAIDVDLSARRALVRRDGKVVRRFTVGIGRPGNTTPTGRYAVTDSILTRPGSPYGCCILALSGRQPNVPQGWTGGDRLAIHGTTNEATVGQAASLGCLRARRADLRRIIRLIPLGARVTIRR
jgi:lipoprotein-anchoring transpeptidase ErfK/SrfK